MFGLASSWPLLVWRIGGGPPVAAIGVSRTFAGYRDHSDVLGCIDRDRIDVVHVVTIYILEM